MSKKLFGALVAAAFLVIPVSVYAYNAKSLQLQLNSTTTLTIEDNQNYYGMMSNYDYMNEMMNSSMHNISLEQHAKFIEEQKLLIKKQLENGELTQEEANERLNTLDQMDKLHSEHHNNIITSRRGCH